VTDNKRRFTRVPFDAEVALRYDGDVWTSDLIDVSLKGLLIMVPAGFSAPVGTSLEADVLLNEEVSIETICTLMHRTGDRIGLRIDRIDMESIMHLRRLMELNLGDPDLLERELSGLGE
jgi:hypothetical protein